MRKLEEHFLSRSSGESELRDRALFFTLSRTALRAAELLSLRWSNLLKTPEGTIAFAYKKKGGRTAFTVPGDEALAAVREYQEKSGILSDFFFVSLPNRAREGERTPLTARSLQRIVHAWGIAMNIEVCRPRIHTRTRMPTKALHVHAVRHSAIQRVFDEVGAAQAAKLASHTSVLTTNRFYTRPFFDASEVLRWRDA